jgi:L-ascorbate 6-phosphate lactonase
MESVFAEPPAGRVGIHFLGQSGFVLVSDGGTRVAIDPYLTNTIPLHRVCPIVYGPEDLAVNHVLLSHDHSDHTDPETCMAVLRSRPVIFWGPASSMAVLRAAGAPPDRLHVLHRGETAQLGDVSLSAVHAEHTGDSLGFVLALSGRVLYHAGDSLESGELYWLHDRGIEVVMAPFSGRWDEMTATQAANLAHSLGARVVIPMSYNMFTEGWADPAALVSAIAGIPGSSVTVRVMTVGEGWTYPE